MDIKLLDQGKDCELLLVGRLDSMSAPEAEKIFTNMSDKYENVTLNLAQLTYISSAGLRDIKILYMALRKKNGEIRVKNCNKYVMEVFEMTGFAGIMRFV